MSKRLRALAVAIFLAGVATGFVGNAWLPGSFALKGTPAQPMPGGQTGQGQQSQEGQQGQASQQKQMAGRSDEAPGERDEAVVRVVRQAGPGVVKISTSERVAMDTLFFHGSTERKGLGTGVVIDPSGLIVTNNHVVADADRIDVTLPDGRTFSAKLMGRDPLTDLAVVRVPAKNLPTIPLADSDRIEVGQPVVAIGNPFGFEFSVTSGIVSALQRPLPLDPDRRLFLENMIQTDASINPGNSGGPLLDLQGRVVGINTAVAAQGAGIGFAIPSNTVRRISQDIIRTGRPVRLGVLGGALTPKRAQALRRETESEVAVDKGAFVVEVMPDTPAAKAGLRQGDVILSVNGKAVKGMEEVADEVQRVGHGGRLTLGIMRGKSRRNIRVELR